jgi:hypothetical protein
MGVAKHEIEVPQDRGFKKLIPRAIAVPRAGLSSRIAIKTSMPGPACAGPMRPRRIAARIGASTEPATRPLAHTGASAPR